MNFADLLEYPVETISHNISVLFGFYYNHVPELDLYELSKDYMLQDKVKIHYLKDHSVDSRRVWQVYYVTFEDLPVMFCKNAGREGDDHYGKAVLNDVLYWDMVKYLKSFENIDSTEDSVKVELEDDASDFISFYGEELTTSFEQTNKGD